MIDIENYKRAIAWLRRGLTELQQEPENKTVQLGVLHRFEVTHNVSEGHLREAYDALGVDEQSPYISLREVIRRAAEEGISLSTPKQWLQYSLRLETTKEAWLATADVNLEALLPILPQYCDELDAFAEKLKARTAARA